jgi:hypothetical protein
MATGLQTRRNSRRSGKQEAGGLGGEAPHSMKEGVSPIPELIIDSLPRGNEDGVGDESVAAARAMQRSEVATKKPYGITFR